MVSTPQGNLCGIQPPNEWGKTFTDSQPVEGNGVNTGEPPPWKPEFQRAVRVNIIEEQAPTLSTVTSGHCVEILTPELLPSPAGPDSLAWAWKLKCLMSLPGGRKDV